MDSFEDFEFKPLTEGLGFHKKTDHKNTDDSVSAAPTKPPKSISMKSSFDLPDIGGSKSFRETESLERASFDTSTLEKRVKDLPIETHQDTQNLFIQKSLPREGDIKQKKEPLQVPKFQGPKFTKSLNEKPISNSKGLTFVEDKTLDKKTTAPLSNKIDTEIRYKYTEAVPSLLSMFLDSTVIAGLTILFTLSLTLATGIDIVRVMSLKLDLGTQIGIFLLAYSVSQLYYILSRAFFGQTLGEWSLEHQLGQKEDQAKISYVFKLVLRTLVLTVTGFVILPLISQLTKSDLSGRISGLLMYRRDQV